MKIISRLPWLRSLRLTDQDREATLRAEADVAARRQRVETLGNQIDGILVRNHLGDKIHQALLGGGKK